MHSSLHYSTLFQELQAINFLKTVLLCFFVSVLDTTSPGLTAVMQCKGVPVTKNENIVFF